jgi:hypothetical protein
MIKKEIVKQRQLKSGHGPQSGLDTKTNWPTDRRSQHKLNLNLNQRGGWLESLHCSSVSLFLEDISMGSWSSRFQEYRV